MYTFQYVESLIVESFRKYISDHAFKFNEMIHDSTSMRAACAITGQECTDETLYPASNTPFAMAGQCFAGEIGEYICKTIINQLAELGQKIAAEFIRNSGLGSVHYYVTIIAGMITREANERVIDEDKLRNTINKITILTVAHERRHACQSLELLDLTCNDVNDPRYAQQAHERDADAFAWAVINGTPIEEVETWNS